METQESPINKFLKVTLVILIVLSLGLGGFIFLQMNKKSTLPNTTQSTNATTITPVVNSDDPNDVNIGSVEADLKDIGTDVESLQ